jgi:hypothetical protein
MGTGPSVVAAFKVGPFPHPPSQKKKKKKEKETGKKEEREGGKKAGTERVHQFSHCSTCSASRYFYTDAK